MMSWPPSLATTWSLRAGRLDHLNLGLGAVVGDDEMLGPDAVDRGPAVAAGRRRAERQRDAARPGEPGRAVRADRAACRKFIAGEPMKPATNRLARPVVELERRADLLDQAVVHDDDLVGHGHGLDLVVGDVDGRGLQPLVQLLDLGAHLHAQLGVEVGQRLVEQEHLRVAHDGAAHGDALALAAGELARIAVEQRVEAEDLGGALDPLRRSRLFGAPRSLSEKPMFSATVMCG